MIDQSRAVGASSNLVSDAMDESVDEDTATAGSSLQYHVGSRGINFRRDYMELESPYGKDGLRAFHIVCVSCCCVCARQHDMNFT